MQNPPVPPHVYRKLHQEYQQLLEKNQSDLIKIKMRQKQLNDKIAGIQQENTALRQELDILKLGVKKQQKTVKSIQESSTTQTKIKDLSLTNQKLKQQIEALQTTVANMMTEKETFGKNQGKSKKQIIILRQELEKANNQIKELKDELKKQKGSFENMLSKISENTEQLHKQFNQKELKSAKTIEGLQSEKRSLYDQIAELQKSQKQMQKRMQQRQCQLQRLQQQKKDIEDRPCLNCKDLQQQVELHQEMLKSVKMMLKFKEMELQKYTK